MKFLNFSRSLFIYSLHHSLKKRLKIMSEALCSNVNKIGHHKRKALEGTDNNKVNKKILIDQALLSELSKKKLKKYALLLSYSGKGYLGMQRNPGFSTIEDELLNSMLKANLITEEVCTCPQIYNFQRAARTDKGVSAARQVVSIKLPDEENIKNAINSHLPEQIRIMDCIRVTKGFDSKNWCDSRTYSYLCPSYAFASVTQIINKDYRMPKECFNEVNELLNKYTGTHNFHNFTAGKKYTCPSAKRYIIDIKCEEPFVRNDMEWVLIKVKGQSFMLHQIRKMIGLCIAICRGMCAVDVFEKAWMENRVDIPIAPGLGLVLEEPHYTKYNMRYGDDGIHVPIAWDQVVDEVETFRQEYIDSTIIETECKENSMMMWLETLLFHTYDVRPPELENQSGVRTGIGKALVYLQLSREGETSEKLENNEEKDTHTESSLHVEATSFDPCSLESDKEIKL